MFARVCATRRVFPCAVRAYGRRAPTSLVDHLTKTSSLEKPAASQLGPGKDKIAELSVELTSMGIDSEALRRLRRHVGMDPAMSTGAGALAGADVAMLEDELREESAAALAAAAAKLDYELARLQLVREAFENAKDADSRHRRATEHDEAVDRAHSLRRNLIVHRSCMGFNTLNHDETTRAYPIPAKISREIAGSSPVALTLTRLLQSGSSARVVGVDELKPLDALCDPVFVDPSLVASFRLAGFASAATACEDAGSRIRPSGGTRRMRSLARRRSQLEPPPVAGASRLLAAGRRRSAWEAPRDRQKQQRSNG